MSSSLDCLAISVANDDSTLRFDLVEAYWLMFFAHWAATEPRETVVSSVRSESGSAERRSMTRQKRTTARSALRRFSSSADGLGEAVLLGTTGEATGVGKGFGWGPGLLQLGETDNKDRRQNTLDERAEPRLHHSPPIDPPSPKESRRPWRSKGSGDVGRR